MASVLQELPSWLAIFVALAGAAVAGLNLGRSRWAAVLLGGFFAEIVAGAFARVAIFGVRHGAATMANIAVALFLAGLLGLAGRLAVVGGVAGLFSEARGRAAQPGA
jgi:hypothetical protein